MAGPEMLDAEPSIVTAAKQSADDLLQWDDARADGQRGAVAHRLTVFEVNVMNTLTEMTEGGHHLLTAVEIVAGVEDMVERWRGCKEVVEGRRIVAGRTRVVVVLYHDIYAFARGFLDEGDNALAYLVEAFGRSALRQQSGNDQQARVAVGVHEVERATDFLVKSL